MKRGKRFLENDNLFIYVGTAIFFILAIALGIIMFMMNRTAEKIERSTEKGGVFYQLKTPTGNDLIETYGVVMLVKNEDGMTLPAVLTLSKTSFIVGKQLTTILAIKQQGGLPVFSLSTSSSSNAKGSWFKPVFTFDSYEKDESIMATVKGMVGIADHILFGNLEATGDTVSPDDEIL